jgi:hypothetical protein
MNVTSSLKAIIAPDPTGGLMAIGAMTETTRKERQVKMRKFRVVVHPDDNTFPDDHTLYVVYRTLHHSGHDKEIGRLWPELHTYDVMAQTIEHAETVAKATLFDTAWADEDIVWTVYGLGD